jgi:hypothetical protein
VLPTTTECIGGAWLGMVDDGRKDYNVCTFSMVGAIQSQMEMKLAEAGTSHSSM